MSRPAVVFIGFMGAGKSTALAAAREAGHGDGRGRRADGERAGDADRRGLRARRRGGASANARPRSSARCSRSAEGGAIALGGGSVLSRAGAARPWPATRSSGSRSSRGGMAAHRALGPAAGQLRGGVDRLLEDAAAALRTGLPTRSSPHATAAPSPGRCPRSVRSASFPRGTRLLWASSALRRVPGLRRPRPARLRLVAAARAAASALRDATVAARYADRLGPLEARVEVEPGEGAKTMAEAERVLRELARAGMTREDHVVALGGGVVGDLAGFCAHTYQRGVPVRRAADLARRPGRLRLRGQDRSRPARGQELRRRLPPAGGGARRHLDPRHACRPRSSPPASSRR